MLNSFQLKAFEGLVVSSFCLQNCVSVIRNSFQFVELIDGDDEETINNIFYKKERCECIRKLEHKGDILWQLSSRLAFFTLSSFWFVFMWTIKPRSKEHPNKQASCKIEWNQ